MEQGVKQMKQDSHSMKQGIKQEMEQGINSMKDLIVELLEKKQWFYSKYKYK